VVSHFVYKLIPPRPTFDADMNDDEAAVMGQHGEYWQGLVDSGRVIVFGPVSDPTGAWGLAVVEADSEDDVRSLGGADPAVTSGLATFEVLPMPVAIVRS
jgi:uncharacterized protein